MNKIKVPAVFDKWYKQVKGELAGFGFKERAMYLIATQGFGYDDVVDKNNLLNTHFNLTKKEVNAMRHYAYFHKEDAMHAIIDGYEVKKEKKYFVRIKGFCQEDIWLNWVGGDKLYFELNSRPEIGTYKTNFTKQWLQDNWSEYEAYNNAGLLEFVEVEDL